MRPREQLDKIKAELDALQRALQGNLHYERDSAVYQNSESLRKAIEPL
jgi:hypothetical protein